MVQLEMFNLIIMLYEKVTVRFQSFTLRMLVLFSGRNGKSQFAPACHVRITLIAFHGPAAGCELQKNKGTHAPMLTHKHTHTGARHVTMCICPRQYICSQHISIHHFCQNGAQAFYLFIYLLIFSARCCISASEVALGSQMAVPRCGENSRHCFICMRYRAGTVAPCVTGKDVAHGRS